MTTEMLMTLALGISISVSAASIIVAVIAMRANRKWIKRYVSTQNVALYLYSRLEMIEHNLNHRAKLDGAAPLDEDHKMAAHHASQRLDVAVPTYSGLIFLDPSTKESIL